MKAADPTEVASTETNDAKGVLAFIVVFPYTTFSSALNDSPSVNELNCKLLSALK